MTKEERDYLFADVSARLPYSPIFDYGDDDGKVFKLGVINYEFLAHMYFQNVNNKDADMLRPYLRPMSSMTEKEEKELMVLTNNKFSLRFDKSKIINIPISKNDGEWHCGSLTSSVDSFDIISLIDWLNAHHFDYRGLIERGLALEALEGMYDFK